MLLKKVQQGNLVGYYSKDNILYGPLSDGNKKVFRLGSKGIKNGYNSYEYYLNNRQHGRFTIQLVNPITNILVKTEVFADQMHGKYIMFASINEILEFGVTIHKDVDQFVLEHI